MNSNTAQSACRTEKGRERETEIEKKRFERKKKNSNEKVFGVEKCAAVYKP